MRRSHDSAPDAPGIGSYRLGRSRVCAKLHTRRSGPAASKGGVIPLYPQSIECGCAILNSDQKRTVPLLRVLGAFAPPLDSPGALARVPMRPQPTSQRRWGLCFLQAEEATK